MSTKTGSAQRRYAGLLPIEPSDEFFRPDGLKPEDVHFPTSARRRPRGFARVLIAFCTGVAATSLWQSYGDAGREVIASSYALLGWFAPRPAITTQNPRPRDVIGLAAPRAPSAEKHNATSFDLDAIGQNNIAATSAAGREPTPRSADQIAAPQEQEETTRNTDQTAISVDQAPATKASNVAIESQDNAPSLQPAARLTEARRPQTLAETGKPLSATSGTCFASASAVLQNHPGGWPAWTMRARGHEGTMCWYAAARPRGSDHHRREKLPREKETVGIAEHELFAPVASQGRGGSWEGGLP
jgi:hypothetical protein